jgi:two-component system, cell cycle response regulator DivK
MEKAEFDNDRFIAEARRALSSPPRKAVAWHGTDSGRRRQPHQHEAGGHGAREGGHTVISAADAEVGLTLARAEQPELILMDMQLPGMDGLAATALLKADAATRAIPVIALTALAMKGDAERIRAAGCDGYVAKPIAYKEFLAVIRAQLAPSISPVPGLPW